MMTLTRTARDTAELHRMFGPDTPAVALVSGGADSMALLRLAHAGELGPLRAWRVLHVNHLLRDADADEDADFVARRCAELGVECRVVRYDVAAYAEAEGLNLEDAGRRIRYRFAEDELGSLCDALGVSRDHGRIAVAHTLDDRLETFLMRLVEGAGAGGLTSLRPVRGRIVRPLADATRADVTAYLASIGESWREDATNLDTTRRRAWVRHELLPLMASCNPSVAETLARTMRILGDEDELLAEMAEAYLRDFGRTDGTDVVMDRSVLATLSRPMARRVVRAALSAVSAESGRIEAAHVEAIADAISGDAFARDLPFGLRAVVEYGTLRIGRGDVASVSLAPGLLELPSRVDLGEAGSIEVRETRPETLETPPDRALIDADAVTWPLAVDGPREGDRMRPLGMTGTKKLSDLLVDAKIPRRLRASVPVVRDGKRVVWLAGVRLSDEFAVRDTTTRVAELVWIR